MTRQILKTFNGYAITYHSDYKFNKFVITEHGKVVERYADLNSCICWIREHMQNINI